MTNTICICEVIKRTPWPSTTFTATIKVNPLCPLHGTGKLPAASEGKEYIKLPPAKDGIDNLYATPVPQPASGESISLILDGYRTDLVASIPSSAKQRATNRIEMRLAQARAEGRREELETIEKFRKMYHNNPNDLYGDLETELAVRLAQLNGEQS